MLVFMATVSASSPGSSGDPLITIEYLQGSFYASLKADIDAMFGVAADAAIDRLDEVAGVYLGYSFTPRFANVTLVAGERITLTFGSSFILISGSATLAEASGSVINVATGRETAPGTQLTRYNRYFCVEDTTASITIGAASVGQVDGYYFVEKPEAHPSFTDVFKGEWYYDAVDYVSANRFLRGVGGNRFAPNTTLSRGMVATALHRVDGEPPAGPGGYFGDVQDPTSWYYDAVTWANANRIVLGNGGLFKPDDNIIRQDMVVIMYRYATYKGLNMAVSSAAFDAFPDKGDVSAYAVDAMRWATAHGLLTTTGGALRPKERATRAETAYLLYRYCETIGR
jgi:hypothetical protein